MCIVFIFPYSCPNLTSAVKSGPFETKSLLIFLLLMPLFHVFSTLSALSFIVQCSGFQHGNDNFLNFLAVACGFTRTTYYYIFDTNSPLSKRPDALRTYQFQMLHHCLALASAGLPQAMACPVLMHAILEVFYDLPEWGDVAPAQVIVWVKGMQKTSLGMSSKARLPGP